MFLYAQLALTAGFPSPSAGARHQRHLAGRCTPASKLTRDLRLPASTKTQKRKTLHSNDQSSRRLAGLNAAHRFLALGTAGTPVGQQDAEKAELGFTNYLVVVAGFTVVSVVTTSGLKAV